MEVLIKTPTRKEGEIAKLLAQVPIIRTPCDLDLLVFLYRHPRLLLTSERIAEFVGYDLHQIARSLESFMEAGLLTRTQNPTHAARMYQLVIDSPDGGRLLPMLQSASTRQGRQPLIHALQSKRAASATEGRRVLTLHQAAR